MSRSRVALTLVEVLLALAIVSLVGVWLVARDDPLTGIARDVALEVATARLQAVVDGGSRCVVAPAGFSGVVAWPARGLQFTPDGLPRTCDGGGVGNTTILLEHRGRRAAVIVSSLGRVRWEMR
jgi:hypothetical protein